MYGLERSCQAQLAAMACNTELNVLTDEWSTSPSPCMSRASVGPYGLLEWHGLLRLLDRKDPSYRE